MTSLIKRTAFKVISRSLKEHNYFLLKRTQEEIGKFFTWSRRELFADPTWRYGPKRVQEVFREAFSAFQPYVSPVGKTYLDLGCGLHHPYGTSVCMFLNGSSKTIAFDLNNTDRSRAAEAVYDLLMACLAEPDLWHLSSFARADFLDNIRRFNLSALREGDLEKGLAGLPLRHEVGTISDCAIPDASVDLMSSRAVLEHFLDFPRALAELKRIMSPGGVAFHHIDLTDHRYYESPQRYHQWSFLTEEGGEDGKCNPLRWGEIREQFGKAGLTILSFQEEKQALPTGLRRRLKGRFADMTDEELSITTVLCVIRNPET